ncbi:small RNA-binding protein 11, chloroplastic-like isoform X2 [Typha angustifolia]|uniref:small RNA-binding protein 11, chloroplastic-like isoform X2 n=1 Tax=Typha angustifolia TaxID=59011 RepID=UPI003C2C2AB2
MAVLRVVSRFFTERSNHFSLLPRPPSNPRFLLPSQLVSSRGVAHKLFVGGLSFYTTEEALSEAFSQFGQVIEAKIIMDKVSVRSKGFGFVTFASEDEAHKALTEMNGKILNGRVVYVDNAKAKPRFDDSRPIARGPPEPADGN